MNYYNEIELSARKWLRELVKDQLIPDGYIDNRPIQEVQASELREFTQCHFFAGIGGWPLALRIAGVADDEPLWTGSCPCQPFSNSGDKMGFRDPRHLFPTWRRIIARGRPPKVFGEQVASALGREWFTRVRLEMASLGYATRGGDICSAGVGAPNRRQRLYWVADADEVRRQDENFEPSGGGEENEGRAAKIIRDGRAFGAMAHHDAPRCAKFGKSGLPANGDAPRRDDPDGRRPPSGMGDTNDARHQRRGLRLGKESAEGNPWQTGVVGLLCSDGKTRRIKPEIFPLAARLSRELGIIRGAGNAINPWIAAEFIAAYYETK